MDKTKLALVGAGAIGKRHLLAIDDVEEAELVAIVDTDPRVEELASARNVRFYATTEAILGDQTPDGVIVCTPTDLHLAPVLASLGAGAHVLVEKPITATMSEARKIIEASKKTSRQVLVGHHRRYYGNILKTKEFIRDGALGELVGISGIWAVRKAESYYEPEWRRLREAGPVLINLVHEIDTLRFVCGEIISISARTRRGLRDHPKEETAAVLMEFEGGALGTFLLSDAAPSPWTWEQATGENPIYPRTSENVYRFVGSEASLDFPNLVLWRHAGGTPDWNHLITSQAMEMSLEDAYVAQCRHFCAVISGTEQPRITALDAARTLEATLAVFEASEKRAEVRL
ncbi:MAG: Gfo/Idh/MocA family oxidoreductase [Dehalococcoidia bacterium]|nr:Gfo/Idh/MocA family oxidoreductase [Dehalococcoidia bacterium]